jgi:hypothetical protein
MNRQQLMKVASRFLDEHEGRCPDPCLLHVEKSEAITIMACRTCGVRVTRTKHHDDWDMTWSWPERDPALFHPGGCEMEPRSHTHDEHGEIQLSLVP